MADGWGSVKDMMVEDMQKPSTATKAEKKVVTAETVSWMLKDPQNVSMAPYAQKAAEKSAE
jgi:hypothetical protein